MHGLYQTDAHQFETTELQYSTCASHSVTCCIRFHVFTAINHGRAKQRAASACLQFLFLKHTVSLSLTTVG